MWYVWGNINGHVWSVLISNKHILYSLFVHACVCVSVCVNIYRYVCHIDSIQIWPEACSAFLTINKSKYTGSQGKTLSITDCAYYSADMIKSMIRYVEEQTDDGCDDTPAATTSHGSNKASSSSSVSPLMSFVMANDTNYKQKCYKPLLKRPTAGRQW